MWRKDHFDKGLCGQCYRPRVSGSKRCAVHLQAQMVSRAKTVKLRKDAGLCVVCATPSKTYRCLDCQRAKEESRKRARKAPDRCNKCGSTLSEFRLLQGRKKCQRCTDAKTRATARMRRRKREMSEHNA